MNDAATKWRGKPVYERPLGEEIPQGDDDREVVWITDFSGCRPASHLEEWTLIDYANDEFSGRMLQAPKDRPAPALTLDLDVTGWYAVYIWLMGADPSVPSYAPDCDSVMSLSNGPELKLTRDRHPSPCFRALSQNQMFWKGLEACFWKYDDLTDQTLYIKHQGHTVYLGAIELVPLADEEVEAVQADRIDRGNKRLIIKGDTYEEQDRELFYEMVRDSDLCAWIAGCHRHEELAVPGGAPSLNRLLQDTRELGIEAYTCDRPGAWSSYHRNDNQRSRLYEANPDWHCLDRDGTPTHQLSYAHPQVQEYMLEQARLAASTGIDGYGYFFCRDPGLMLFEPAAMNGFQEKHGVDPLALSDRDGRLLDWRADIFTRFLRRMRQVLDEVAEAEGFERIKMVHVVLGSEAANRFFSFDVATWVREGLVDVLCPYPWADYPDRWLAQAFVEVDVAYFTSLCSGTDCKVYPMWVTGMPSSYTWVSEHIRPNEYFRKAIADYGNGADGISTWDAMGLAVFHPFMRSRWLRLGHKELISAWEADDFPLPPKLRFTQLDGETLNRYPPGTGG